MAELPVATHERIVALSAEGDALAEEGRFQAAIDKYDEAWALLPAPKRDWEAAIWLLAALGDAKYQAGDYPGAVEALTLGVLSGALGNPFVHLRLGQSCFELGRLERATDELLRAYMAKGAEYFEDEPPKYWEFLRSRVDLKGNN